MKKFNVSKLATLILAAVVLTGCGGVNKMMKMASEVKHEVTPKVLELHGDSVSAAIKVTFPAKFFQKKATLTITPVFKYEGGETAFPSKSFQGESVQGNNEVVSFVNGGTKEIPAAKIAFVEGMRKGELIARVKASDGSNSVDLPEIKLADGTMSTALLLDGDAMPIAADDKFVRITTEQKGAAIHFVINQANIRDKELNKEEIKALKQFVKESVTKENVEFKGVEISAYASPDGELDLNTKLADKRMVNAQQYFARELDKAKVEGTKEEGFIKTTATPEDWEGFKSAMEASEIQDKDLILRVLSMYSDPVVREKEIKNIAAAYEVIKEEILPELRRSKMYVNIAVVGYSDEELKDFSVSNPDTLKVEELMYAATLHEDINTKLAIYQKVAENFSDDWRGHNNVGYALLKLGKVAEAKAALEKAKSIDASNTIVLNNLGVVAYNEGDVVAAEEFYTAAAGAGNQVSYNRATIAAKRGQYEDALNLYVSSKYNTLSFAITKVLNYSFTKNPDAFDAALGILKKAEDESAKAYYFKAVIGARKQDSEFLMNSLRTACEKDASYKAYAQKDIEFAQYAADATFKSIVE